MRRTVLLAGGGTGGHVFPLVAVAQALRAERPDVEVVFVGTVRGLECQILPRLHERLELLDVLPIQGGGLRGVARGVARAAQSLPASMRLVRKLRPAVVLSIGGYAAGPVSLAAHLAGVPVAVLEPNSVVGLTNILLGPVAKRAYVAFPEAGRRFRASRVRHTGVPIRSGFVPTPYEPSDGLVRVLVLGGSQGAGTLNSVVPAAIARTRRKCECKVVVTHQSGREREEEVRDAYAKAGATDDVTVVAFVDDVPTAVAASDIVIGRAGASAVAELCAVGRSCVLVPYPYAAGDHQLRNALALQAEHAAFCVPPGQANSDRIGELLLALVLDPSLRVRMADSARRHGRPDAARSIAVDLLSLAKEF